MPAWITSELRELVCVPIALSASSTTTSRPLMASSRATASPTTPPPITATSKSGASCMVTSSLERADVLGDARAHRDVEAGLRRNVEARARAVVAPLARAVEPHAAAAGRDVHALGGVGAEVKFTGINETQSFLAAVREEHGVGHHLTVEIDVRFGDGRHILEFHARCHSMGTPDRREAHKVLPRALDWMPKGNSPV